MHLDNLEKSLASYILISPIFSFYFSWFLNYSVRFSLCSEILMQMFKLSL